MPKNATQYQIAVDKEQHKRKLELFKEQYFVERSLKSKVINAFDETYLTDIKEDSIGCNNVSIHAIFKNLYKSYGKVVDADYEQTLGP